MILFVPMLYVVRRETSVLVLAQMEAVPVSGVAEFKELEEVEGLEEQEPRIGRSVVVPLHHLISLPALVLLSQNSPCFQSKLLLLKLSHWYACWSMYGRLNKIFPK